MQRAEHLPERLPERDIHIRHLARLGLGWTRFESRGETLLPRDHVAAMSARITAPPAAVWAALSDPAKAQSEFSTLARQPVQLLNSGSQKLR